MVDFFNSSFRKLSSISREIERFIRAKTLHKRLYQPKEKYYRSTHTTHNPLKFCYIRVNHHAIYDGYDTCVSSPVLGDDIFNRSVRCCDAFVVPWFHVVVVAFRSIITPTVVHVVDRSRKNTHHQKDRTND